MGRKQGNTLLASPFTVPFRPMIFFLLRFDRPARLWWRAILAGWLLAGTGMAYAVPVTILFVGNSYTFGRVDPVMSYNAANVHDLTAPFMALSTGGTNAWEPHPWGGVPGIFKQFTQEAGLDYDVSISARNGASLRDHFLNTAAPGWNLRGNIASRRWDVVVLQEQSDVTLPVGKGKHANPAQFHVYANALERFIHQGQSQNVTDSALYGSLADCMASGESDTQCSSAHQIAANPNANPAAEVYLTATWARPDMVFAHTQTKSDSSTVDGRPMRRIRAGAATLYYSSLSAMTHDLHAAIYGVAAENPHFAGVIGVGDSFQLAVDSQLVKDGRFYDRMGRYMVTVPGEPVNLWWYDGLHASRYGSYLDALVQFGTLTGRNPRMLGAQEHAAQTLGIAVADAQQLQEIAARQLGMAAPVPAGAP